MPRAVNRATLQDGVVISASSAFRSQFSLWYKRVDWVPGGMVLDFKHGAVKRASLEAWVRELRLVADGMEEKLKEATK